MNLFLSCMCDYFACMYVFVLCHAWCPWRPEESVRVPGTGVTNGHATMLMVMELASLQE